MSKHNNDYRYWDDDKKKMITLSNYIKEGFFNLLDFWSIYYHTQIKSLIMLYTGKKDKNGKKIFENDILVYTGSTCPECGQHIEYEGHKPYMVWYNDETCSYECSNPDNFIDACCWSNSMEIIGNKFETPDLWINMEAI